MQTRYQGNYKKGFYAKLNNSKFYHKDFKKSMTITDNSTKRNKILYSLINEINCHIIKKLKAFTKQSHIVTQSMRISCQQYNILKHKFSLNGRFRDFPELTDYGLIKERFFNQKDSVVMENFQMRIQKGTKFIYFDKTLNEKCLISSPLISFKYIRKCKVQ